MSKSLINGIALIVSVVLVSLAAGFGAQFGPGTWYRELVKPSFNPPDWVFGPVWTLLYLMMAVAAWLVWRKRGETAVALPLAAYGAQMLLNALWSWLFFGLHRMGLAFTEILLLDAMIVLCIVLFWRVSRPAALMLVPYCAWVSFAAVLNFTLWRLNF